jgi:hypothetical protein
MPDVNRQVMARNGTLNPDTTVNAEKARAIGCNLHAEEENPIQLKQPQTQTQVPAGQGKIH